MDKLVLVFYRLLMTLACVAMVAAFGTVMLGVVAREMGWNISGLDAYAGYAIAAALFLALPSTLKHGDHIRVTLVLDRLPPRIRGIFEWWCLAAAALLSLYVAWFAARLVWVSQVTHDISPGADASPLWIPQLAMALGCVGLAVAFIHAIVQRWQGTDFLESTGEAAHVE